MKHLQLFEKFQQEQQDKLIEFTFYTLTEHTDDSAEEIYGVWLAKEDAIEEARGHRTNYPDIDTNIEISTYRFKIPYNEFIDILEYDKDEASDFELTDLIDEFKDLDWGNMGEYYESDSEIISNIEAQNKITNTIIDDVIYELNRRFKTKSFSKYTNLYKDEKGNLTFEMDNGLDMDDESYIEYESITIRIADHTHNPRNGANDLNVLIVNDDKTLNMFRFARTDLRYDGSVSVDEIVNDIINYWK